MEPASLMVGMVTISGLFKKCLACFELLDVEETFSKDIDIALAKLDVQRAKFVIWGNAVGLHGEQNVFVTGILSYDIQRTVYRLLWAFKSLFEDAVVFRERYGMKQIDLTDKSSSSVLSLSKIAENRFTRLMPQDRAGTKAKTRWAIRDEKGFLVLLNDLRERVDQFRDITQSTADLERQRRTLEAEVSSMFNIRSLGIFEDATKDDDPNLSDVVSQRIIQLTEGSTYETRPNPTMFAVSACATAGTYNDDLSSDSGRNFGPEDLSESQTKEPFLDSTLDATSNTASGEGAVPNAPVDAADIAFSQPNNLKSIQMGQLELFNDFCSRFRHPTKTRELVAHAFPEEETVKPTLIKRIMGELNSFYQDPEQLISLGIVADNPFNLLASIQGPSESAYEGGVFFISISIPHDYPFRAPKCFFLTPILHPYVSESGEILIDGDSWNTAHTLRMLLLTFLTFLSSTEWDWSCRPDISDLYKHNPRGFEAVSKVLTQRYAQSSEPPQRHFMDYHSEIYDTFFALAARDPISKVEGDSNSHRRRSRIMFAPDALLAVLDKLEESYRVLFSFLDALSTAILKSLRTLFALPVVKLANLGALLLLIFVVFVSFLLRWNAWS